MAKQIFSIYSSDSLRKKARSRKRMALNEMFKEYKRKIKEALNEMFEGYYYISKLLN